MSCVRAGSDLGQFAEHCSFGSVQNGLDHWGRRLSVLDVVGVGLTKVGVDQDFRKFSIPTWSSLQVQVKRCTSRVSAQTRSLDRTQNDKYLLLIIITHATFARKGFPMATHPWWKHHPSMSCFRTSPSPEAPRVSGLIRFYLKNSLLACRHVTTHCCINGLSHQFEFAV